MVYLSTSDFKKKYLTQNILLALTTDIAIYYLHFCFKIFNVYILYFRLYFN